MAKILVLIVILGVVSPRVVAAQSKVYGGGTAAVDSGQRGNIDLEGLPAAGAFVGWRFSEAWSAEFHVDRAFGESVPRSFEELIYTGMTLRSEAYGRTRVQDRAGEGFSALAVWRSGPMGRVRAAVTMGLSDRRFKRHETMTISRVGPDVPLPPDHPLLQPRDETITLRARGLTAGFMVPITVSARWTVAPEIRLTRGLWNGYISSYTSAGARVMWGF